MGASRRPVFLRYTAFFAVLLVFFLFAGWYNITIPLGEGPDESGHVEFVWWLARETGTLPNVAQGEVLGEGHQPPLAYWLLQPAAHSAPPQERYVQLRPNPNWIWAGGNEAAAFGRRSVDLWPFSGDARAWHLMRLQVTLISCITLFALWLVARRLGFSWWTAWSAMALLALWPQFIFHSALVSNDPLLWCLVTLLTAWLLVPKPGRWWGLGIGVLLGTALLTKQNAVIAVPLIAAVTWLRRSEIPRIKFQFWVITLTTVSLCGWWFIRNLVLYGDLFGLAAYQQAFGSASFNLFSFYDWRTALGDLASSTFARFGWMNVAVPGWMYMFAWILVVLAYFGLWRKSSTPIQWKIPLVLIGTTVIWVLAFGLISGMVAWQGRFLLPALAGLFPAFAWGLLQLDQRGRILGIALGFLFLVNSVIPSQILPPIYEVKTIQPQPEEPLLGRWDPDHTPAWELRALEMPLQASRGTTITIDTLWTAAGFQDRPWSMFWHLAKPNEKFEVHAFDLQPTFSALRWTPGDWWRETIQLPIPADLPPGTYDVRLGWFDQFGTQQRAAVRNRDGTLLGDYVTISHILVTP